MLVCFLAGVFVGVLLVVLVFACLTSLGKPVD